MKRLNKFKIFFIITVASLLLFLLAFYYYKSESNAIIKEKHQFLDVITNFKLDQIADWKKERISSARFLPTIGKFIKYTAYLNENKNNTEAKQYFSSVLDQFKESGYDKNIFITDIEGNILFSLDSSFSKIDQARIDEIKYAVNIDSVVLGSLHYHESINANCFNIISVIKDNNGIPIGALVQHLDPNKSLLSLIKKWPTSSKTAETLLFIKEKDHILYLNELRHKKSSTMSLKIPLSQVEVVAVKGAQGARGIIEGKDYRGVDVLADLKVVPGTDWYMVTKVDKDEIYSELFYRARVILIIALISLLLVIISALYIYKLQQSQVYKNLFLKEKELSETQEEYKIALYSIGDGVMTTDTKGIIKQMNYVAEKITGWDEIEAIGKPIGDVFKIVNEDTNLKVDNPVEQVLKRGTIVGLANHTMLIRKDGGQLPIADSGSPIKDAENKIIGVVLVFRDQTENREKERMLTESEERYRVFFENNDAIILMVDPDNGNIIFANHAAAHFYSWSREQLLGMNISKINTLSPEEIKIRMIEARQRKQNYFNFKHRISNGDIRDVEVYQSKLQLNDREIFSIIVNDITERLKAEAELLKLSRAVRQSPASIIITNPKGEIEYVNPKFTEITGYSFEEIKGNNPKILKSGLMAPEVYKNLWKDLLSGREWRGEFYNKKKNGELYWESATISSILNNKNEITNFISVQEDITEKKKLIDDLILAKEKAEEMNRVKAYFFANMSHELRTPFVGIMGFSELLAGSLENPEQKEMAEQILKSSNRLTDTLNKILTVTRLEFDKLEVKLSNVDIVDLIKQLVTLFSKSAVLKNTTFKTVFQAQSFIIQSDAKLLAEIISNIINNAIKFTQNGVIEISTAFEYQDEEKTLIIKVSDTGLGIPNHLQKVIWDEFRQASEGMSRSFEGTGLGLTLVKKYVIALGGKIHLDSELGKGTTFTIELPLEELVEKISKAKEIETSDSIKNIRFKNKKIFKILFVEDDTIALQFITIVLKTDYDVDTALTADSALNLVSKNQYDVLMLDINLGKGMDGIQLMQEIKKIEYYKNIPVIAVTAYAAESDKAEFLAKGFTHYISKPFSSAELKELLAKIFH